MSENIGSITIHASCDSEEKLVETLKSGDVLSKAQDEGFCIDEDWSIEDITSLGVYLIYNRVRDQNIRVWIVKKDITITEAIESLEMSGYVHGRSDMFLMYPIRIADILKEVQNRIREIRNRTVHLPRVDDCEILNGTSSISGTINEIGSLGVYGLRLKSDNDVGKIIKIWVLKKNSNGRDPHKPLLKSGEKEGTHYFVSSKNGGMVRTSRDDVRAHVTNEINLANMGGDYIEDIGLRCDPLERFFKHAKPGDHTEFDVGPSGNKMMVRVIRLRNEVD